MLALESISYCRYTLTEVTQVSSISINKQTEMTLPLQLSRTGITNIPTLVFSLTIITAPNLRENVHVILDFQIHNQRGNSFKNAWCWNIFFNSLAYSAIQTNIHDGSNAINVEGILHIFLSFVFVFSFVILCF